MIKINNSNIIAKGVNSMLPSGNQGGSPVMSHKGQETIAHYMCYQTIGKSKQDNQQ